MPPNYFKLLPCMVQLNAAGEHEISIDHGRADVIYGGKCTARGRGSWEKNGGEGMKRNGGEGMMGKSGRHHALHNPECSRHMWTSIRIGDRVRYEIWWP